VGQVVIGNYCQIAANVRVFLGGDHHMGISTYPFGHPELAISQSIQNPLPYHYNREHKFEVEVGNDVWLGYGTILFRDVTIGDGAITGAFSIITKDIPPYAVVVGHSRTVKRRFSAKDIRFLLRLKWWNFTDELVAEIAPILLGHDVQALRTWYGNYRQQ